MQKFANPPYIFISIFILLLCRGVASCSHSSTTSDLSEFDKEVFVPSYASGFKILGAEGRESVLIESVNPWQGSDSVVRRLFIVRGGEEAPTGFDGEVLEGKASRIVAMSSTHLAMLDAIGEVETVVGLSGLDFVSNPKIRSNRDKIGDVGYDGNIDYELLLSVAPQIVLLYGTNGASGMEAKLRELDIPFIYIGDYLEQSPLGKAEWMVVLGEITGERERAEKKIGAIAHDYNSLVGQIALVDTVARARPKVMLNAPYGDAWFLPPSGSYMAQLIRDAGGDYLGKANLSNSSQNIDREKALLLTEEADVWLNTGSLESLDQVRKSLPQWAGLEVVNKGKVYNNTALLNPGGGNDFYESGTVRPDLILHDLVNILQPSLLKDSTLVYYYQLR